MKVKIVSPGATTYLPWDGEKPIFNVDEPERSILEKSWEESVLVGLEPKLIPDPEPIAPELQPHWQDWQLAMFQDSAWQALESNATPFILAKLMDLKALLTQVANYPETVATIGVVWGIIVVQSGVSQDQRDEWRAIAQSHNLPQSFIDVI